MEDGNALVYGSQRNSGAAAFNQPALQIGHTPLDVEAQRLYQENQIRQQQQYAEAKQKEKEKAAALKGLEDIDLSTFAIANQQEIGKDIYDFKNARAQEMMKGENPTDPTSPAYLQAQKHKLALQGKIIEANKQGKIIDDAIKAVNADYDNPNPVLDHDKTMAAIKAYSEAPNMDARRAIDPNSLLVRKPKKIDILSPLKDVTGDYLGKYEIDNPLSGKSGTYIRKKQLKENVEAAVNNPKNEEDVLGAMKAGDFKDKQEYIDYLYKVKENGLAPDSKVVTKAPKATTLIDIEKGNTQEQLKALGVGEQVANVTVNNSSGNPVELSKDENGNPVYQTAKVNIPNAVMLGQINVDVPNANAIDAATGKPFVGTGSIKIVSGTMGTPLVYSNTNRIVPLGSGSSAYKDKNGKWVTVTGTPDEISQKLIDAGAAEYKPMLLGVAEAPNAADNSKTDKKSVWLPANTVLHPTDKKDKALTSAEAAYHILDKASKEKNKVEGNQTQEQWNAAWDKLKTGETMTGLDGKTYVKS